LEYSIVTLRGGKQRTTYSEIMPTIKVHDWTKEQLDDIKDEEEHSSYDSVIKSLLKERQKGGEI